jgi:hypothetical protein
MIRMRSSGGRYCPVEKKAQKPAGRDVWLQVELRFAFDLLLRKEHMAVQLSEAILCERVFQFMNFKGL